MCQVTRPRFSLDHRFRKRLAPTRPPPHHQAAWPHESRPSPTKALPHRHRHGPTTLAPAKPRPATRETGSAKQSHPLPQPRPCATQPQTTTGKPNACSLGPANLTSLFNVPCAALSPLFNPLRLGLLRPRLRDGGRGFLSPFHHGPGVGKSDSTSSFHSPGPNVGLTCRADLAQNHCRPEPLRANRAAYPLSEARSGEAVVSRRTLLTYFALLKTPASPMQSIHHRQINA